MDNYILLQLVFQKLLLILTRWSPCHPYLCDGYGSVGAHLTQIWVTFFLFESIKYKILYIAYTKILKINIKKYEKISETRYTVLFVNLYSGWNIALRYVAWYSLKFIIKVVFSSVIGERFYLIVEGVREAFFVTTVHPKETILSRVFNDESRKRGFKWDTFLGALIKRKKKEKNTGGRKNGGGFISKKAAWRINKARMSARSPALNNLWSAEGKKENENGSIKKIIKKKLHYLDPLNLPARPFVVHRPARR